MTSKCDIRFLLNFDLFGKIPKFYFQKNEKIKTFIGSFATILYSVIYTAFFVYKIVKMSKKVDITFYETYTYTNGTSSINLTNDIFYGGFSLLTPDKLLNYIDETIYYPKMYYKKKEKINNTWNLEIKELELETCKLEKFGSKYKEKFKDVLLDNLYCLKDFNENLFGYMTADRYSYLYIEIHPCVNNTYSNIICKPKEIINKYIMSTYIEFKLQDIELTPQIYQSPIRYERKDVQGVAFKNLLQNIYTHLQLVNIETNEDIIGIRDKIVTQKYLRYDESFVHVAPGQSDIFTVNGILCTITIQLGGSILTQKRTFPKLIDVFGEVGGFMGITFSAFQVIIEFITDILYDISMINILFGFDSNNKKVLMKKKIVKRFSLIDISKENLRRYSLTNDMKSSNSEFNIRMSKDLSIKELNGTTSNKNNENNLLSRNIGYKKPKRVKVKNKSDSSVPHLETYENNNAENINMNINAKNIKSEFNNSNSISFRKLNNLNNMNERIEYKETIKDNNNKHKKSILNKIDLNIFTYFLLLINKKQNLQKEFLNKGKIIISEKLDILYIFKKLYKYDSTKRKKKKEKKINEIV